MANCYHTIALTGEQRDRIEEIALARLRRQHEGDAERLQQLNQETSTVEANRGKLLDAYYADAVPRSLFLSEQQRLKADQVRLEHDRKAAAADITELEQQLLDVLDLLQDAHDAYEKASEPVRKQLNRALFARILLGAEPSDIRVELNEP